MSPDENTSQHTTRPDPIKMAFSDKLADAVLGWYNAALSGNILAFTTASDNIYALGAELKAALDARESGREREP